MRNHFLDAAIAAEMRRRRRAKIVWWGAACVTSLCLWAVIILGAKAVI